MDLNINRDNLLVDTEFHEFDLDNVSLYCSGIEDLFPKSIFNLQNNIKIENEIENNNYNIINSNNNNNGDSNNKKNILNKETETNIEFTFSDEVNEEQREEVKGLAIRIFKLITSIESDWITSSIKGQKAVHWSPAILVFHNCIHQEKLPYKIDGRPKTKIEETREIFEKIKKALEGNIKFNFEQEIYYSVDRKIKLVSNFENKLNIALINNTLNKNNTINYSIEFIFDNKTENKDREKVQDLAVSIFKSIISIEADKVKKSSNYSESRNLGAWVKLINNCVNTKKIDFISMNKCKHMLSGEIRIVFTNIQNILLEKDREKIKFDFRQIEGYVPLSETERINLMNDFDKYLKFIISNVSKKRKKDSDKVATSQKKQNVNPQLPEPIYVPLENREEKNEFIICENILNNNPFLENNVNTQTDQNEESTISDYEE